MRFDQRELGEVIHITSGKVCPSNIKSEKGPFPIIGANGTIGHAAESLYDIPIIIVGRVGSCGEVHRMENPCWPSDNTLVITPKEDSDFDYIEYCLRYGDMYPWISGSTQPLLTQTALKKMEIPWPDRKTRHAVGLQGRTLEKLTISNQNAGLTISKLISSLFRSWFIDFDPVKAKVEDKLPFGMNAEIAALFPDTFDDSELGPIPTGWKVGSVEDILDVSWGDTDVTKKSYSEEGFPAFSAKGRDGYLEYYDYDEWGIILTAIGANCGNTWIASGKWSCIKNTMRFIELKAENEFVPYFYYLSKNPYFWPIRGSAQPFIGMNDVKKIKILIPNSELIQKFSRFSKKMLDTFHMNETLGEKLSRARDALLPRLMSGELKVN